MIMSQMLLSSGLMLLTNYIASCLPVKPMKFGCIGSDAIKPIIMWQML